MAGLQAPQSFSNAQRDKVLEQQQAMTKALKEQRYEAALEHARTVKMLDPSNAMANEFVKVLEEKLSLEDDSDDEATNGMHGEHGEISGDGESSSDDESDDDDDEDDDEDGNEASSSDGSDDEDGDEAGMQAEVQAKIHALALGDGSAALDRGTRREMRQSLARSIKDLLNEEFTKKMAEGDPLLGA